jgi:hypothetical protein
MANLKIPQFPPLGRTPTAGDLLLIWDGVLSKTTNVDVTGLPYGEGVGTVATALGSPYKVRNTDPNYAYVGTSVVITDPRLLGKSDYVVSTTQLNIEFDDYQITCDPIAGSVTISNFQLQDGSHITIYADGVTTTSAAEFYASLVAQLTLFAQMLSPFATTAFGANGAKVWWIGTPDTIPAGWQECIAMRGYIPIAQQPADVYDPTANPTGLSQPIGTTLGAKTNTLVGDNIPPFTIPVGTDNKGGSGGYPVLSTHNVEGLFDIPAGGAGTGFSVLNPVCIGMWIEFIGV